MKRKNFFLLLFFILPLIFTSCVDVVQTIDFKNGNYQIGYRITMTKAFLEMSGENPENCFSDEDFDDFPEEVTLKKINTSTDIGYGFDISISPKTTDETKEFLPKVLKDGRIEIPLILSDELSESQNSDYDPETKAISEAMLSSAKWRVFVTKNLLPSISKAYLENEYGTQNVDFFEVGDVFVISIPFVLIKEETFLRIEK